MGLIAMSERDLSGSRFCREKLIELHQISVAKETLRQWMTEAGIWISRRERKKRVF